MTTYKIKCSGEALAWAAQHINNTEPLAHEFVSALSRADEDQTE